MVLGHALAPGLQAGGMAGVHLFFVLSGFLITGLLLAEHDRTGRVDLPAFWARRALRLFPALWAFLLLTVGGCWLTGARAGDLLGAALPVVLYVANLVPRADLGFYAHTWSLSLEEQFYLLWPVVLVGLLWLASRRGLHRLATIGVGTGLLTAASLTVRLTSDPLGPAAAQLPATAFALLAGGGLALVSRRGRVPGRRLALPLSVVATGLLLWGHLPAIALGLPDDWLHLALVQVLASLLLISAASSAGWTPFRLAGLRRLGQVSYGWYLWHYPLLGLGAAGLFGLPATAGRALALVASLGLALTSWHLLERPLLVRWGPALRRPRPGRGGRLGRPEDGAPARNIPSSQPVAAP